MKFEVDGYGIDWKLLRIQKVRLLDVINEIHDISDKEALEGILLLVDHVQDNAVDSGVYTESDVFGGHSEYGDAVGKWKCTDPSCQQWRLQINETTYKFKEMRVINPQTLEANQFEATIDVNDYSLKEIYEDCLPFGYEPYQILKWMSEHEDYSLIAECIFEMTN